jgi:glycosyltransferase involved in cell wall biosynthesis
MTAPSPTSDDRPLRILQIVISPDPGGVLALSESIREGLSGHGHVVETAFVVPNPDASYVKRLGGALQLAGRMLTGRYDALIGYQPSTSILVGLMGALLRNPRRIVHQTTVPAENSVPLRALDWLVGSSPAYRINVVNTVFTREQYRDYPRAYRRKVVLIEHGVPVPATTRSRTQTLARFGIPDQGCIVLNTARLDGQKNHTVLLQAMRHNPQIRLVVAGDGAFRPRVEAEIADYDLGNRVHLLGRLCHAEALELYGAADAFVFPSMHETFGISAVEAAMFGLPVVASDIGVLREVLQVDGKTAVRFVAPQDAAAWTSALRELVHTPPDPAATRSFASALALKYSECRMIGSYLKLLRGERLPGAFPQQAEVPS